MIFVASFTVPLSTPEDSPTVQDLRISHGVIHRVEIEFEKWTAGLLHVQLFHANHQLYPLSPRESFASDGATVEFDDYFQVFGPPYFLQIRGWNDDDTFGWTARIRVGVMPEGIARHMYGELAPKDITELRRAFGLEVEGE